MRTQLLIVLAVAIGAACAEAGPTEAEPPEAMAGVVEIDGNAAAANGAQVSTEDVVVSGNDPSGSGPAIGTVVGRSHLTRTADGIRANVRTSGLTPGDAVTLWLVVFQDPDQCVGACDFPPEDLAPGRAANALGGGHVVPSSGKVTLAGKLDFGDELVIFDTPAGQSADVFDTLIGSEVHLVIRTHGPAIPGMVEEQTGSFNGGCPPNACASIQAGIHGR